MHSQLKLHHENVIRTHAHLVERRASQRATGQRIRTSEHVMASLQSDDRGEVLCRLMPMRLTDRSAGGLGLESQQEIAPGERISIHFPSRIRPTQASSDEPRSQGYHPIWHGRVVRCEHDQYTENYRIGVESGQRRAA